MAVTGNHMTFSIDGTTLLQAADIAMYHSKQRGANAYLHYVREIGEQAARSSERETELRLATGAGAFRLLYQPIFEARVGNRDLLQLDAEAGPAGDQIQQLREQRHALALPRVQLTQFGRVVLDDQTAAVGGAVQGVIVDHHQLTVGRLMHVALDHVDAHFARDVERGQRIGRSERARPAVPDSHKPVLSHGTP